MGDERVDQRQRRDREQQGHGHHAIARAQHQDGGLESRAEEGCDRHVSPDDEGNRQRDESGVNQQRFLPNLGSRQRFGM